MMAACCDRLRHLPGGPMCPIHGRQKPPRARPKTCRPVGGYRRSDDQYEDDQLAEMLVRVLERVRAGLAEPVTKPANPWTSPEVIDALRVITSIPSTAERRTA